MATSRLRRLASPPLKKEKKKAAPSPLEPYKRPRIGSSEPLRRLGARTWSFDKNGRGTMESDMRFIQICDIFPNLDKIFTPSLNVGHFPGLCLLLSTFDHSLEGVKGTVVFR